MVEKKPKQAVDEIYSEEETARRRDEALLRALRTPPQPRKGRNVLNTPKSHKDKGVRESAARNRRDCKDGK